MWSYPSSAKGFVYEDVIIRCSLLGNCFPDQLGKINRQVAAVRSGVGADVLDAVVDSLCLATSFLNDGRVLCVACDGHLDRTQRIAQC